MTQLLQLKFDKCSPANVYIMYLCVFINTFNTIDRNAVATDLQQ